MSKSHFWKLPGLAIGLACGACLPASLSAQEMDCPVNHPTPLSAGVPASAETCRPRDFPCESIPAPTGIYVRGWQQAMIGSAARQRVLINRREWFAGGTELGPEGLQHLNALALDPGCEGRIVIEAEPVVMAPRQTYEEALKANGELNELRRQVVITGLQERGWIDADQVVTVSNAIHVGIRGIEAPMIYSRGFQNRGRGNQGNSGSNNGGMGSSGFGSGGMMGGGGGFF